MRLDPIQEPIGLTPVTGDGQGIRDLVIGLNAVVDVGERSVGSLVTEKPSATAKGALPISLQSRVLRLAIWGMHASKGAKTWLNQERTP